VRAVYAALDPATAILEVAVHETFKTLSTVPHVLTSARIADAGHADVVNPADVPNHNWLRPGAVSTAPGDRHSATPC
jgi:RES domain-containing protein